MKPDFKVVDLCKDLSNKTAKNVRHIAIESPYHERLDALTKVRKYTDRIDYFSELLWRYRSCDRFFFDEG